LLGPVTYGVYHADWTFDCSKGVGKESVAEFTVRVFVTDDETAQGTYAIDFDVDWGVERVDDTFGDEEGLEFGTDYTYPNSYIYTETGLYDVEFKATLILSSNSSIEQLLDISGQALLDDGSCTYPYVAPPPTVSPHLFHLFRRQLMLLPLLPQLRQAGFLFSSPLLWVERVQCFY